MTAVCLRSGAGPALVFGPALGWTFTFAQAQPIGGDRAVTAQRGLANAQ
jgi:hypothetical protein